MYKKKLSQKILFFSTLIFASQATQVNAAGIEQLFSDFNHHLEKLEKQLASDNYKEACKTAKIASNLIKENLVKLKVIEPDYNWREIKEVLLQIPKDHC